MLRALFVFSTISLIMRCNDGAGGKSVETSTEGGSSHQGRVRTSIASLFKSSRVLLRKSYGTLEKFKQATVLNNPAKRLRAKKFAGQFYLFPYQKTDSQKPPYDINVLSVWQEDENYGDEIKVMIMSDGLDTSHPDLSYNYDGSISYDFVDGDDDPNPYSTDYFHGTRAAGLIAMNLSDTSCGIGVAPEVVLGAIRLIDLQKSVNPENFINALRYKSSEIDIVLLTWQQRYQQRGPLPSQQSIYTAYKESVTQGRHGKGIVHVVPAGLFLDARIGEEDYHECARNVNVNSIYTIAVGASNYDGSMHKHTPYCSAVMVTAYSTVIKLDQPTLPRTMELQESKDCAKEPELHTTDVNGKCSITYGGTEAAASIVAGVIALALRANPLLTWRDVQHLIAWTSVISSLQQERHTVWRMNKSRFYVNPYFGFGMINAYNLVRMGKTFEQVPPLAMCEKAFHEINDASASEKPTFSGCPVENFFLFNDGCAHTEHEVNYIEHIQLIVALENTSRSRTQIHITSPGGTRISLASINVSNFRNEIRDWIFDSVMTWGESPRGSWFVTIYNSNVNRRITGKVNNLILRIYGTKHAPAHYKKVGISVTRTVRDVVPRKYWRVYRPYEESNLPPQYF